MKKLFFIALILLWTFDSNSQSFQLVKDINTTSAFSPTPSSDPGGFFQYNGNLIFSANEGNSGIELWHTDGTALGTQMIKDIHTTQYAGSHPASFIEYNGFVYFTAGDSLHGKELYVTDGTLSGTNLVRDINQMGTTGSNPYKITRFNSKMYFSANDGVHGRELWMSDGTNLGTQLVLNINSQSHANPRNLTEYNGKLYFSADNGLNGNELWVTDGTIAGTQLFLDLNLLGSSNPDNFIVYNSKLYFTCNDGMHGLEIWVTDGTLLGTQLLKDINPSNSAIGSVPHGFTELNNKLYFVANDSIHGEELWVTDGTLTGTHILKDINPVATASSVTIIKNRYSTTFNGKLYFRANDFIHGSEIWVTDGTTAGTYMLADIYPGTFINSFNDTVPFSGIPFDFTEYNGNLYFTADDSSGRQLWITDGTTSGTSKIMYPNATGSGFPHNLTLYNGAIYFSAYYTVVGNELWKLTASPSSLSGANIIQRNVQIYPNPSFGDFEIVSDLSHNGSIEVYTINGKRVYSKQLLKGKHTENISLPEVAKGVYLYKILENGIQVNSGKLLLQ